MDGVGWMGYAGWKWEDICQARIEVGYLDAEYRSL